VGQPLQLEFVGDLGDWYGVETDSQGRVVRLNLADNNLRGELPSSIGNLSRLQYINIKQNRLTGRIPPASETGGRLNGCCCQADIQKIRIPILTTHSTRVKVMRAGMIFQAYFRMYGRISGNYNMWK
jgi:hypothetical protein